MTIACLSPNGQNLHLAETPATRLLVATLRGIAVLERAHRGAPWVDRGRKLDGHHCGSLMIEPRHGGIFPGMHSGGLFSNADRGEHWQPRRRGLSIPQVFSLGCAHPGANTVLYAGTEPASIFRSDDYGESWVEQPGVK